jgi:signal transduction histidine kinase
MLVFTKNDSEKFSELAVLIENRRQELLSYWLNKITLLPGARELNRSQVRDHVPELLNELAETLRSGSTAPQLASNTIEHGVQRWKVGFDITEVVAEYHILRDCVERVAQKKGISLITDEGRAVGRIFDQAIANAAKAYASLMTLEIRKRREEHLSFVVHDLRAPLQAIALALTMLERSLPQQAINEDGTSALSTLKRNITRLEILMKTVLQDEANLQFESPVKIERREFDLWPLIESIVQDMHPIATDSRTTLRNLVPHDITIFADARPLGQAFQNLISNAIKFTPSGTIIIGAKLRDSHKSVVCWVQDTGTGIETERLTKIFDNSETDQQPHKRGSGLGFGYCGK